MEKVLNYEYGCKIIAPLKKQAVGEIDYHYYNENGEEAILVTKSLVARIDGKEYLYRENTNNRYKLKELLPDYNNGKCEKLLWVTEEIQ